MCPNFNENKFMLCFIVLRQVHLKHSPTCITQSTPIHNLFLTLSDGLSLGETKNTFPKAPSPSVFNTLKSACSAAIFKWFFVLFYNRIIIVTKFNCLDLHWYGRHFYFLAVHEPWTNIIQSLMRFIGNSENRERSLWFCFQYCTFTLFTEFPSSHRL